jgi:3-dehydroquinate synthase
MTNPTTPITVSIPARPAAAYDIHIGGGIRHRAGDLIASLHPTCRVLLLTDDTVAELYARDVAESLTDAGFTVISHIIPHGEGSKVPLCLLDLVERMAVEHLTRSDLLVALGGGVVGDLGGFAAAIYQRGIPYVQMPTTLLAMVDSSVGGKTAVDLEAGKNLCGAFHQPALVICDPDCLDTLPYEFFSDGMAEVIKYAFIRDRELFGLLQHDPLDMEAVIRLCVNDKRVLVEADETDRGARQLLNLGHTVGHAAEFASEYTLSHGHAVAMGMVVITRAAVKQGLCGEEVLRDLIALLKQYGLPTECPFTPRQLYRVALSDKKRAGDRLTLAVPHGVADTRLITIPADALEDYIRAGLSD